MADEKNPESEEPQEESAARAEGEEELSDEELEKVAGGDTGYTVWKGPLGKN
jgi:hypothetical protein